MEAGIPLCSRPGSTLGDSTWGLMQGLGLGPTDNPSSKARQAAGAAVHRLTASSLWERRPQPLQPPFPEAILGLCLPLGGG